MTSGGQTSIPLVTWSYLNPAVDISKLINCKSTCRAFCASCNIYRRCSSPCFVEMEQHIATTDSLGSGQMVATCSAWLNLLYIFVVDQLDSTIASVINSCKLLMT